MADLEQAGNFQEVGAAVGQPKVEHARLVQIRQCRLVVLQFATLLVDHKILRVQWCESIVQRSRRFQSPEHATPSNAF